MVIIETKVCNRCGIEKPITEFSYRKKENVYRNPCKECKKKYLKEYNKLKKEKLQEYRKEYYSKNKEHKLEYQKEYRKQNLNLIHEKQKKYNSSVYPKTKEYKSEYYKENKEEIIIKQKEYIERTLPERKKYRHKHYMENKEKIYSYVKNRKKTDVVFKLKCQVRNMLWESFNRKSNWKRIKGKEILGCDLDYFINYLLETYKNNYGYEWDGKEEIHIDHIIPLASAKTEDEITKLCHYKNLQLLKSEDNLKKSNRLDWKINKEV